MVNGEIRRPRRGRTIISQVQMAVLKARLLSEQDIKGYSPACDPVMLTHTHTYTGVCENTTQARTVMLQSTSHIMKN